MSSDARQKGKLLRPTVLIVCDLVVLEAAFLATYWFRFHAGLWPTPLGIPPLSLYAMGSIVVLGVFFGLFYARGMYATTAARSIEEELTSLFKSVVFGSLLVLALAFFLKRETYSRSFFGLFFLSCFFFLTLGRIAARWLLRVIFSRGMGRTRLLLIGDNPMRDRILRAAWALPGLALEPVGWLAVTGTGHAASVADPAAGTGPPAGTAVFGEGEERPEDGTAIAAGDRSGERRSAAAPGVALKLDAIAADRDMRPTPAASPAPDAVAQPGNLPCLGTLADIQTAVKEHRVDLAVLTLPFDQLSLVRSIATEFADLNTDLYLVPDLQALHTSRMRLTEIAGIPFISVREVALSGADRIVKRTFDLVSCGVALLLMSPLFALLALLVKLSSPGPIFYHQSRIGRDGREFQMHKFRSMRVGAESGSGPVWTVEKDKRVTPIGAFLRRFSLDELPQLWNVLLGDMSLVGPRPERQVFVEEFRQRMPRYFERHRVRSGLTGWAQVHGLRGNTSIEDRTIYDLYYVENWSLALDVKIILMTIHHVLRGENAY